MLYIDCLVCNTDRHGSNWKLEMNLDNRIHSIAPLFDHGSSVALTNYNLTDGLSQIIWDDGSLEMNHFNLFSRLVNHNLELVKKLLDKTESIDLSNKVKLRFKIMKGIYNR